MTPILSTAQSGSFPGQFVHSVYFWLNNPDSQEDRDLFLKNLHTFLENSQYLTSYHVAPPAGTDREVVDNSYDYNLVVTFDSKELQDQYQTETAHLTFVESSKHLWDRVQIYDSFREPDTSSPYLRGDIQIGVVVSDLNASEAFYTDVIGMEKVREFTVNEDVAKRTGLTEGAPLQVSVMKLRNDPHASEWKLMEFADTPEGVKTRHINQGKGMRYVTFYVHDMENIMQRLKAHQITLLGETPIELGNGQSFILVQDPDGIFIELIGPTP
jgi:catechol 2,3-dioxygenase-like lactoylglutathione lyase family enzyme